MKTAAKVVASAFLVVTLSACATAGNDKLRDQTQASMAEQIKEGVTTKAELKQALGDPVSVSFTDSGKEIWTYKFARATPKAQNFVPILNLFTRGADVTTKELVVLIEGNVVSKYTMRETETQVKRGLAQ
jgi:outer membrane protein assembly factor BamE (lipoprotein component of BamABCDE complex)